MQVKTCCKLLSHNNLVNIVWLASVPADYAKVVEGAVRWKRQKAELAVPVKRDEDLLKSDAGLGSRTEQQTLIWLQFERYLVQADGSILFLGLNR